MQIENWTKTTDTPTEHVKKSLNHEGVVLAWENEETGDTVTVEWSDDFESIGGPQYDVYVNGEWGEMYTTREDARKSAVETLRHFTDEEILA